LRRAAQPAGIPALADIPPDLRLFVMVMEAGRLHDIDAALAGFHLAPFPIPNIQQILTVLVDVMLVLDQLVMTGCSNYQ
jgi:hypothetical protein